MNEIKVTVTLDAEFEIEGIPFQIDDQGTVWVNGETEVYDFDNQVVKKIEATPDSYDEEFEITLTQAEIDEAKAYRAEVESHTAEDFEDEIDAS